MAKRSSSPTAARFWQEHRIPPLRTRKHKEGSAMRLHTAMLILALASPCFAQGTKPEKATQPMPPLPRLSDGTPNLSWSDAAHQGVWTPVRRRGNDQDLLVDRKTEGIPFQPWAKAIYEYRVKTEQKDDPEGLCLPPS